jgi:dienelactone hydrolase
MVRYACIAAIGVCTTAWGSPIAQVLEVPIVLRAAGEADTSQFISVLVVRDAGQKRRPFLVLEHGRQQDPARRRALGRVSYPANSAYFASLGFVVLIPTRAGYGISGGSDIESTGGCGAKDYQAGLARAVSETRQLLDFAARLPYVDRSRGLIAGESFGGMIAIAAASARLPGVLGTVNFAGGDGGDPLLHPEEPCQPELLSQAFAAYGAGNRIPTLWIYSANDRFWGPAYPGRWFAAFRYAGGTGTFVALPAAGNNGHYVFSRNALAWRGAFESFAGGLKLIAR